MAKLLISGRDGERQVEIGNRATTLGADRGCDVVVTGADVSPEHCSIQPVMGAWKVVDLESDAGTRVNGAYVNQRPLRAGDVLELGDVRIVFHDEPAAASAAAPVAAPVAAPIGGGGRRAPAQGTARAAPGRGARRGGGGRSAGRSAGGDREAHDSGREERRARRPRRRRGGDAGMMIALIVGVLLIMAGGGYLMLKPATSPNEQVFLRMRAAENRYDWQAVVNESQAGDLGDPDFGARIAALRQKAEQQLVADQGRVMLDESESAFNALISWRQKNRDADEEFVAKIDDYLNSYERWGGAPVELARQKRAELTGSSSPGEAHDAPTAWSRLTSDVRALKANGQFGLAIDKVRAFRTKWGSADPAKRTESAELERELATDAGRWFAVQVSRAHHKAAMGSKLQGRRVLEKAAEMIGIQEYEERAAVELEKLMAK